MDRKFDAPITKDKEWKGHATDSAGWALVFAYTQNRGIHKKTALLVMALEQYGMVLVNGFEISLAGRDGNLLNRKKLDRWRR